jgi:hypothetical protein
MYVPLPTKAAPPAPIPRATPLPLSAQDAAKIGRRQRKSAALYMTVSLHFALAKA